MDFDSANAMFTPKRLKTLASSVMYAEGNSVLHQFVLDHSPPNQSPSESYLNAHLRAISGTSLDVNKWNDAGYSPLHLAALKQNLLMVKKLLSCFKGNIDANARCNANQGESTALHLAATFGHLGIIQELLNNGADVNIQNLEGDTALCLCLTRRLDYTKNILEIIKVLVDKGANVHLNDNRRYPLDYAQNRVI